MNAWSHLPNARHIDWLLESLKSDTALWSAAWIAVRTAALDAALDATRKAVWDAARDAARHAARDAAPDAARHAARDAARIAARTSLLALVVYDDCQQYLDMTYDQLLTYAALSEKPQAVLLLPMKWVQEQQSVTA